MYRPTDAQLAEANYGSAIAQSLAESQARAYFHDKGVSESQSSLTFGAVERGYVSCESVPGGYDYGFRLYATLNEKDAAGYFKGPVNYIFLFRDEQIGAIYRVWGTKPDVWDLAPRLVRIQ
ncbi:MAG: hypothetical protein Q8L55_05045 [Phycisphaerales bacterium]|nr:hypothetical protein [Phycisphaerales bacterium]